MALSALKGKPRRKKPAKVVARRKQGGKLDEPNWEGSSEWSGEKFHR